MSVFKNINICLFKVLRTNTQRQVVQITRSFSHKFIFTKNRSPLPTFQINSKFSATTSALQNEARTSNIHDTISSIQFKKRVVRKKKTLEEEEKKPGMFNVVAFATAEEYNLEKLFMGLKMQNLYEPTQIENNSDVLRVVPKYKVDQELRELFFFRDGLYKICYIVPDFFYQKCLILDILCNRSSFLGSVVMWNITDLESSNILRFLRQFEEDSYSERLVQSECEVMNYKYQSSENKQSCIDKQGDIVLAPDKDITLNKFTFSNAMMLSVKLAIWEASLEKYINDMEFVTEDLKRGKINMTREQALKKHGELFALRHYLNLSSDVLDTPDFYWDNEDLENLYSQVCSYFCINKRTKVMNEKLTHCVALIELLSTHLSNKHGTRLEWTIIVLIMVEVFFETIHYLERYVSRKDSDGHVYELN